VLGQSYLTHSGAFSTPSALAPVRKCQLIQSWPMKTIAALTCISIALIAGVFIGKAEPLNCEGIGKCNSSSIAYIRRGF
jgi:hypothetical protein